MFRYIEVIFGGSLFGLILGHLLGFLRGNLKSYFSEREHEVGKHKHMNICIYIYIIR